MQLLCLQKWSFLSRMMAVHTQHHCCCQNILGTTDLWRGVDCETQDILRWMLRLWSCGMYCSIAGYLSGATVRDEPASFVILGLVGCSIFVAVGVGFFNQLRFLCFLLTNSLLACASVVNLRSKGKDTVIPLQAQCGPEGSRRFRLPDFMTFGTWRWWGCQPHTLAAFTPQECSWYSFSLGAESTPTPWCSRKEICHWKNHIALVVGDWNTVGVTDGSVEVHGRELPHCHFVQHRSHLTGLALDLDLGLYCKTRATECLIYGPNHIYGTALNGTNCECSLQQWMYECIWS